MNKLQDTSVNKAVELTSWETEVGWNITSFCVFDTDSFDEDEYEWNRLFKFELEKRDKEFKSWRISLEYKESVEPGEEDVDPIIDGTTDVKEIIKLAPKQESIRLIQELLDSIQGESKIAINTGEYYIVGNNRIDFSDAGFEVFNGLFLDWTLIDENWGTCMEDFIDDVEDLVFESETLEEVCDRLKYYIEFIENFENYDPEEEDDECN